MWGPYKTPCMAQTQVHGSHCCQRGETPPLRTHMAAETEASEGARGSALPALAWPPEPDLCCSVSRAGPAWTLQHSFAFFPAGPCLALWQTLHHLAPRLTVILCLLLVTQRLCLYPVVWLWQALVSSGLGCQPSLQQRPL